MRMLRNRSQRLRVTISLSRWLLFLFSTLSKRKKIIHKLKQKIVPDLKKLEKRAETPKERRFREDIAKQTVRNKEQKTIEQLIEENGRVDETETTDDKTAVGT